MKTFLIVLSSCFFIAGIFPYLAGVIKKQVKPKVITWFIWTVLTSISLFASIAERQYTTIALLSCSVISTALVVILGWKYGDKKIERLDILCLTGAIIGVVLWQIFNSPWIAVVASIVISMIGAIPTLIHSWEKPGEEAWVSFLMSFIGAFCTILALENYNITAFAHPLYLFCSNLVFSMIIISRRQLKGIRVLQ